MKIFTVIYQDTTDNLLGMWQFFRCQADDADHAEEQCINAYPDSHVLWVNEGYSQTME